LKKFKTVFAALCGAAILFGGVSCKKYEEGGRLGAADRKIVNSWTVEKAIDLETGGDITADFSGEIWEFTKDDIFVKNGEAKGTYSFTEDKLTLVILEYDGSSDSYRILKMKSNEMWLEDWGSEEIHFVSLN